MIIMLVLLLSSHIEAIPLQDVHEMGYQNLVSRVDQLKQSI